MATTMLCEESRRIVANELHVDEALVAPDASFVDALMADSIELVDLMLKLEEIGPGIPMEAAWQVQTVGDAYRFCSERADEGETAAPVLRPRMVQ